MKPLVNGNIVMINGPRYDLPLVIRTHKLVLDAFVERFGAGFVCGHKDGRAPHFPWPGRGPTVAEFFWEGLNKEFDAHGIPLFLMLPPLTLQVRLLGMQWCVQDAKGDLRLHDGTFAHRINPQPTISIFGPYDADAKEFGLLPLHVTDAVGDLFRGPLAKFDLEFDVTSTVSHAAMKAGLTDSCRLRFPHDVYGNGSALLAVRCVASEGGDPKPSSSLNPFMEN